VRKKRGKRKGGKEKWSKGNKNVTQKCRKEKNEGVIEKQESTKIL
jgi:hypothetical protein